MPPIIEIKKLSKKYKIGTREPYYSLRDSLSGLFNFHKPTKNKEEFWALKDINFNVAPGDAIGIIGRNGAGKSTLLKVLSRITPPTMGKITMRGRIASLLEVGTGFHPELTGRENIFLNGAILGMSRTELKQKFDAIVDFAEITQFIDTPVKRYSSGMYVRLAFAVAAHLEPEVLIVDEVLAVGDIQFQKKCLGKMEEVGKEGRTVIFVSHNMSTVQTLCKKGIWLDKGKVRDSGEMSKIASNYMNFLAQGVEGTNDNLNKSDLSIKKVIFKNSKGKNTLDFAPGDKLSVEINYECRQRIARPHFWVTIASHYGPLFTANMLYDGLSPEYIEGNGTLTCTFDSIPLLPNMYGIMLGVRAENCIDDLISSREIGYFNINAKMSDIGFMGSHADEMLGNSTLVVIPYTWQLPNGQKINKKIKLN